MILILRNSKNNHLKCIKATILPTQILVCMNNKISINSNNRYHKTNCLYSNNYSNKQVSHNFIILVWTKLKLTEIRTKSHLLVQIQSNKIDSHHNSSFMLIHWLVLHQELFLKSQHSSSKIRSSWKNKLKKLSASLLGNKTLIFSLHLKHLTKMRMAIWRFKNPSRDFFKSPTNNSIEFLMIKQL